jgi:hypothetical protein
MIRVVFLVFKSVTHGVDLEYIPAKRQRQGEYEPLPMSLCQTQGAMPKPVIPGPTPRSG